MNAKTYKRIQIIFIIIFIAFSISAFAVLFRFFFVAGNAIDQRDFITIESIRLTNFITTASLNRLTDRIESISRSIEAIQEISKRLTEYNKQFESIYREIAAGFKRIDNRISESQTAAGNITEINKRIRDKLITLKTTISNRMDNNGN